MRISRGGSPLAIGMVVVGLLVAGCDGAAATAGLLTGDPATDCVWGEESTGDRYAIALPPGWTATTDPVTVLDEDGRVVIEEGDALWGGEAQFPFSRSGRVVCDVEGAVGTIRFSDLYEHHTNSDSRP